MTAASAFTLFVSLLVLAVIPGPGIFTVTTRTVSAGFRHGVSTTAGIVTGDVIYISFALLGLATLSGVMGEFFVIIKYMGAAYLMWLGVQLLLSKSQPQSVGALESPSHIASYSAGLLTTLGNPKAILFYVSFLPTLLELNALSVTDALLVYLIAIAAISSVMLVYAYVAYHAKRKVKSGNGNVFKRIAGSVLVGSGMLVAARS